jgi:hypothetical protein
VNGDATLNAAKLLKFSSMKKTIRNLLPNNSLSVQELFKVRGGTTVPGEACGCSNMCKKKACKTEAVKETL